mgnify:CR=1 FL=1
MKTTIMPTAGTDCFKIARDECQYCFFETYSRLLDKFRVSESQRDEFLSFFKDVLQKFSHLSAPEIQRVLFRGFCTICKETDPFFKEKKSSNALALEFYKEWKPRTLLSENPFQLALKLSIAGNIIDYGANHSFELGETIHRVVNSAFAIDHSGLLQDKIKRAGKILYLGDNAGEIVFDRLFIETFMHPNVTYSVKSAPVLNDALSDDAFETGMDKVADVISNGYDAPSTLLSKCSLDFLNHYYSSDLIISKGQGNLEGLFLQNDPRIFYLLMVKCKVVANVLDVEPGGFVVFNYNA